LIRPCHLDLELVNSCLVKLLKTLITERMNRRRSTGEEKFKKLGNSFLYFSMLHSLPRPLPLFQDFPDAQFSVSFFLSAPFEFTSRINY